MVPYWFFVLALCTLLDVFSVDTVKDCVAVEVPRHWYRATFASPSCTYVGLIAFLCILCLADAIHVVSDYTVLVLYCTSLIPCCSH
jgi:hypothetical protein